MSDCSSHLYSQVVGESSGFSQFRCRNSLLLLSITEELFDLAAARQLHRTASYLPDRDNMWADALSRQRASSLEWELRDEPFLDLVDLFGCPQIDLFASLTNHRLPQFLTRFERTKEGVQMHFW
ncbi:hypothetical protein Pcinc_003649 [Petrolisthes cinctipes]|uniref:Uncharacterized protein n=1 Tax=Petrolisthes cinctipes TaxID=88211 RepID=A0AAE1L0X0_PETCI|nr:hypothetical protein Pcinc_003649 [Petrolisthes cinctipes]